jgi:hypothetical protein
MDRESRRLAEDGRRESNWKRWGPYLSERQWGTVREDYSASGDAWSYFPHEQARSRAYRWGEDGLLGLCDRQGRLCFALALWNGRDPFLKERLFGLSGPEGNHGEDVKEAYFYLDSTPTHSYTRALYKYPQREFPYDELRRVNRERGRGDLEYDLEDTGIFDEQRYFDVTAEYAKGAPNDLLIRLTIENRGPDEATLHLLPTLWFRNTWSWGRTNEGYTGRPSLAQTAPGVVAAQHESLGAYRFFVAPRADGGEVPLLFTENETNTQKLYGSPNKGPVKDAFHAHVISGTPGVLATAPEGTKCAAHHVLRLAARGSAVVELRLTEASLADAEGFTPFGEGFTATFAERRADADAFYAARLPAKLTSDERNVSRQAYAGLLFTKQFFHYNVEEWLAGDPAYPAPPAERLRGRNREWKHVLHRDVISMPDKWEYPWFAAWDLAFHMIPFANVDPNFAKDQLILFLREWYMHPNGQLPAYEWNLGDVNPPVHAWAAWRVYKLTGQKGARDRQFLARVFQKLLLNFTWWVNRKDAEGNNLFGGGFLGLDNIGIFDRSKPLPTGGRLEQADGTAWMAFYCTTMLSIALELAREDPTYEDVASKFFEHFVHISDAMNTHGGSGLWDERDGFYYDQLLIGEQAGQQHVEPMRIRSMVGIIPLFAVAVLDDELLASLPGFRKRMEWFLKNRPDLSRQVSYMAGGKRHGALRLLAIPSRERLTRVLRTVLDEREMLSPFGVRSMSRAHKDEPFVLNAGGQTFDVRYVPGESDSGMFGGNSNWRGPVWMPVNYLLVEALDRYYQYYGDSFRVECPTDSGTLLTLAQIARELQRRLTVPFVRDEQGRRPCHGADERFAEDPHWKELVLFHEYFHGDTGRGLGASHQTGWTALVASCLDEVARRR